MHSSFLGVRTYLIMSPQAWVKVIKCLRDSFYFFYNIAKVRAQNHKFEVWEVEGFYLFAFLEKSSNTT